MKEMHELCFLVGARSLHFVSLRAEWQVSALAPRTAYWFSHWRLQLALAGDAMFLKSKNLFKKKLKDMSRKLGVSSWNREVENLLW